MKHSHFAIQVFPFVGVVVSFANDMWIFHLIAIITLPTFDRRLLEEKMDQSSWRKTIGRTIKSERDMWICNIP